MALEQGQILNNRYRIVRLLGQGGFGAVYQAWDMNLERPRAIKENLETSPEAQRQFKREAQMLSDLTHPNLPKVIDHFVIPGQGQYLVMEFIEGQDLRTMLEAHNGPLPEDQAVGWIRQVCQALIYLHGQQPPVIHRDIKPANIRITPQGRAVLVDFGIAKLLSPGLGTTVGARAVTPGYSPLEQYGRDSHTDERTDVYALAATLYTLLTGNVPAEALDRSLGSTLPDPRRINPAIAPHIEAALLKALAVHPEQRTRSMAAFLQDLERASGEVVSIPGRQAAGAPPAFPPTVRVVESEPTSRSQPVTARRPSTSWQVIALAGGFGMILLLTLCAVGVWLGSRLGTLPTEEAVLEPPVSETSKPPAIIPNTPTSTPWPTNTPTLMLTPSPTNTPTEALPSIDGFIFCDRPCSDPKANPVKGYPEETTRIYLRFNYRNMQPGMKYIRTWYNQGEKWVRYECEWKGPQNGSFDLTLWDSMGLRSGEWVMQIEMPGYDTITTSIGIEGRYSYWSPAGELPCADW